MDLDPDSGPGPQAWTSDRGAQSWTLVTGVNVARAEIGLLDLLIVLDLLWRSLGDDPTGIEDVQPLAQVEDERQIVVDKQDGAFLQIADIRRMES